MDLSLEVGNYCRRGSEPKQIKWKMYLEVNGDDSALAQIRVRCMESWVLVSVMGDVLGGDFYLL